MDREMLETEPEQEGWYQRAVKARNALNRAIVELRGGHAARVDQCDEALAELDIVLGLAPFRIGTDTHA